MRATAPLYGQRTGTDPIVKQAGYQANTGTFTVPGRTVAVFQTR